MEEEGDTCPHHAELQKIIVKNDVKVVGDVKTPEGPEVVNTPKSPFRRQAIVCLGTFLLTFGSGATAGFSAVLIPQLKNAHFHGHHFNTELVSWVAAMSPLPMFFGNMISGYLMERFGRKSCQIMLSVPSVIGWVLIAFATNIYMIIMGRFITGFCQGWLGPLGPIFMAEISTPKYRGSFLAGASLSIAGGVFFSHVFGTYFHWSLASVLCGLFPFFGGIIIVFSQETPNWFASKGRIEECIKSFHWYRGNSLEAKSELDKLIADQIKKEQNKLDKQSLIKNMRKPEFWKPLIIMVTFFLITQLSGTNVICAYTPIMMEELLGNNRNSYTAMLAIDIIRVTALTAACFLMRHYGRRPMAIYSGIVTSLSLIALAGYLYFVRTNVINNLSPVISIGLMSIYMVASNIGIVPLPWNMVGELFATATKGIGSSISVMMTSISVFATVKTAPGLFESIGFHGTYLFYGISTLLGTIYLMVCLPETKDKTLLEVEEYFRYGKKKKADAEIETLKAEES